MRQEHGVRVPVPHLLRADIDRFPLRVRIYVQEQLGGIHNLGNRVKGMPASDDREKGHRVQDKQEGAGHPEEVAHHHVRGPGGLQFRKTVKHIEGIPAFLLDCLMDLHSEGFKPVRQRHTDPFYLRALRHKLRMAGKTEIDNVPPVLFRLLHKRNRETAEFIQV